MIRFRELDYRYIGIVGAIVWDLNSAIGVVGRLVCGGGRLERFYCITKCFKS